MRKCLISKNRICNVVIKKLKEIMRQKSVFSSFGFHDYFHVVSDSQAVATILPVAITCTEIKGQGSLDSDVKLSV